MAAQLFARFVSQRLLGSGGSADVWEVLDPTTGEHFALKIPHPWVGLSQRLLREGRVQARLTHPNLLPVLQILDLDGRPGLLMPLVQGAALDALLKRHRPDTAEALALMHGIVRGVAHAHAHGLIHRDLKPANVLIDRSPTALVPRVTDFGLVKGGALDELKTATGAVLGTPAYLAPEQMMDASRVDHRADLWSLGVMLYELLTGRRPFAVQAISARFDEPPDLSGLPRPQADLLADLLQPDLARRLPDCVTLLARLDALLVSSRADPLALDGPLARSLPSSTPPAPRLPQPGSAFVGRQADLAALSALLSPGALVTITGTGGTGKTRLALELARRHPEAWPEGVHFIDLSEVHDLDGFLDTVAQAVGHHPEGSGWLGRVQATRGERLFILDNFEQLISITGETVGAWTTAAPRSRFLVTSRLPLHAAGERVYPLDTLGEDDAAALFLRRAAEALPGFSIAAAERPLLQRVLALLDGLPLAIELAAARLRTMTLGRLRDHLDQRFRVLTSRSAALPPRQRTLRAVLQGSWDLLDAPEQQALAQLSVFEGGFTAGAADAVLELEGAPLVDDLLAGLSDAGLLRAAAAGGVQRSSMLLSVQEFAREKLTDSDASRRRHAEHFATMGSLASRARLEASTARDAWEEARRESENLLAAGRFAVQQGLPGVASRCALAYAILAEHFGSPARSLTLLEAVLPMDGADRVPLGLRIGRLAALSGDMSGARAAIDAVFREDPDPGYRCRALLLRADLAHRTLSKEDVEEDVLAARQLAEDLGDRQLQATAWRLLGKVWFSVGQNEASLKAMRRATDLYVEIGDQRGEGATLTNLSRLLLRMSRLDEMEHTISRAVELTGQARDVTSGLDALQVRAMLYQQTGRYEESRQTWEEAIAAATRQGARRHQMLLSNSLGTLEFRLGRLGSAERAFRHSLAADWKGDFDLSYTALHNLGFLCFRISRSEDAVAFLLRAAALARHSKRPVQISQNLAWLGNVYSELGRQQDSAAAFDEAIQVAEQSGDEGLRGRVQLYYGAHLTKTGAHARAEQALEASLALLHRAGELFFYSLALSARLDLSLAVAPLALTRARAEESARHAAQYAAPVAQGKALGCIGLLAARCGDLDLAAASFRDGEALIRDAGDHPELASLLLWSAEAARLRGAEEAAATATGRARQLIEGLGCGPDAPLVHRLSALSACPGAALPESGPA